MSTYSYPIGEAPLADGVVCSVLHQEIKASALGSVFSHIVTENNVCSIYTTVPLDASQQVQLDAVVSAHSAIPPVELSFHGSATVVQDQMSVDQSQWMCLGGVVTTPSFFAPVASLVARITGSCKTSGGAIELRLMEDGTKVLGTTTFADSSDTWQRMVWQTDTPASEGTHEYTLEAKLMTAVSAAVRYVSMSVLEVKT